MKISLLPLYSKLNDGVANCLIATCRSTGKCCVAEAAPDLKAKNPHSECPLSSHQAETCAAVMSDQRNLIIFNTSATGDGKSLAAQSAILLDSRLRSIALYPTIELVADQDEQLRGYLKLFQREDTRIDLLYGAELAERVAKAEKGEKYNELHKSLLHSQIILTNPDIFHLIAHFQYRNFGLGNNHLPMALNRFNLYIADEFHVFGAHQEAAILNSLLLLRNTRGKKPMKVLFTSATPREQFIQTLKQADFQVKEINGEYKSILTAGYRQIAQPVQLEFVKLEPDADSLTWLIQQANMIRNLLNIEAKGRGLIVLNSVALVSRAVRELQKALPNILVREISGRIDRRERENIRKELTESKQPVLAIGTSAVDVGVDFRIHLLIFEASDSATFIQRFGRLGRHEGYSQYHAFVLLSNRTPWIEARLKEQIGDRPSLTRPEFREIIENSFDEPKYFHQYRNYWGALQAQGLLLKASRDSKDVMQSVLEQMSNDLRNIYGAQLDKKRSHWFALGNDTTGKAIQEELLRFRGGSELQVAVWDDSHFYTYDLLRLLPYAKVELCDRNTFLQAAMAAQHSETEFSDRYITAYLEVNEWSDTRFDITLETSRGYDEIKPCCPSLLKPILLGGNHPQRYQINQVLRKKELLTFLVQVDRKNPSSHWDILRQLRLPPTFGLYRLTDGDDQAYACAFNQDALLLESMKWRIRRCENSKPYIF